MSCPQCSTPVLAPRAYCPDCGGAQNIAYGPRRALKSPTHPVFVVRGVFDERHQWESLLPVFLFLILWSALGLGGFLQILLGASGVPVPLWLSIAVCGGLSSFLIPILGLRWTELAHQRTEFAFHHHRLVQESGVWFPCVRSVPLEEIGEVRVQRDGPQERRGLGTILLTAHPDGAFVGTTVCIPDVPDPESTCSRIRDIVNGRRETPRSWVSAA